jgi:DNA repair photolyase
MLIEYMFDSSNYRSMIASMRWESLLVTRRDEADEQPALFEPPGIARTFDTPGFRDMTFYEIRARSIINRVPKPSRVPFDWTINPYRGCGHQCVYCLSGDTPVLMADGRTKPIALVRRGEALYGTVRDGAYRRYVRTTVLAQWQTVKPAFRVTLEDGTSLITSGDHRFLTDRGWKYVTGTDQGGTRRPHLTTRNELLGTGAFAAPPKESDDYRRGYLCGMIRGDGHLGEYHYQRRAGGGPDLYTFRLALTDDEALDRTSRYLAQATVATTEFAFSPATATRRPMRAIRTSAQGRFRAIQQLIQWPADPCSDWRKGFLAGLFDAEGSCSRGILRISNTDPEIIGWAMSCLRGLGFDVATEPRPGSHPVTVLRLRGGLKERLRFFHSTDPAISRKRTIDALAIKGDAKLRVAAVEPLELDLPMYDITTGTGDFIANGVVSHNCFARNTHTYLGLDAGRDFDTKVVVKVNAVELARKELAAPRWPGAHIAMGTNVDCYQRAEGKYRLMPGIIGALRDAANPFSILTKGTLILRDLELLAAAAEVTDVGLNVSVGFVDKSISRFIEPGAPSPQRRLGVCAAITKRGLSCGVLMGPVLPYLTDSPGQLADAVRQIADAGASHISPIVLHLRPGAREWFAGWLRAHHPDLVPHYRGLYGNGSYAPGWYQQRIAAQVADLAAEYGVGAIRPTAARAVRPARPARPARSRRADAVQLPLL